MTSAFAPTYRVGARGAGNQGQWNVVASHSQVLGAHSLKFGVDFRKMTSEYNPQNYQQSIFFSSIDGIVAGETAAFAGVIQAFRGDQVSAFHECVGLRARCVASRQTHHGDLRPALGIQSASDGKERQRPVACSESGRPGESHDRSPR